MNKLNINTSNFKIVPSISNVYSFTSFSGTTINNYTSTSTCSQDKQIEFSSEKCVSNFYTINLDWFQFLCQTDKNGNVLESYSTNRIIIHKNQTHNNPNFKYKYTVAIDHCDLCDLYAIPINCKHKKNEISVKVHNSQLYTKNWCFRINYILTELEFTLPTITKIDIALDGCDILSKKNLFRRYLRTKTVQISNNNLQINGNNFNKEALSWESYTIGSKKYQKTAELYDKTKEIKVSGKQYIYEFWVKNGLDTSNNIGRFELKLGLRHLSKYKISSFDKLCDAGYLGKIFIEEVNNWMKFYQVSLTHVQSYRKDIAIRKGKELKFILWDKLPKTIIPLEKCSIVSDGIHEAKRVVTHTIGEILKEYSVDSTHCLINFVEATATEYKIYGHTIKKIISATNGNPVKKDELKSLLNRLSANTQKNCGTDLNIKNH